LVSSGWSRAETLNDEPWEASVLLAADEGSSGRTWVFTDPELEALIDRVSEVAVRRVLAEHGAGSDE
jgi:hypothetical protein